MKIFSFIIILISIFYTPFYSQNTNANTGYSDFEKWEEWEIYTDDRAKLFVREFGTGDTVVVLHGGWGAEHSALIDPLLKHANNYHFVLYDQRGSLRSKCVKKKISVENHIKDVERVRKALGAKKILLLGHSMGGFLALSYLQKYPDNVKGVILISSPPAKGTVTQLTKDLREPTLKRWQRAEVLDSLKANGLVLEPKGIKYTDKQWGTWHRITFAAMNLHHVKNWRKVRSAFFYDQKAGRRAASKMPKIWDFTAIFKEAKYPITFIHGDDDYLSIDLHKAWISGVPSVELKIIKNAGHMCWIDQAEEFDLFLGDALKK